MTNPIDNLMVKEGASVYYDFDFRVVLESHLTFLRTDSTTSSFPIDPHDAYRYEGDLYGLLYSLNVSPQYHWLIMRMNDFTSPTSFPATVTSLLIPQESTVENIRQLFMISHKIS